MRLSRLFFVFLLLALSATLAFAQVPPSLASISPARVPVSGGDVTLRGTSLTGASVSFAGDALAITANSDTEILATIPARPWGVTAPLSVTTAFGSAEIPLIVYSDPSPLFGDADNDGSITTADARLIQSVNVNNSGVMWTHDVNFDDLYDGGDEIFIASHVTASGPAPGSIRYTSVPTSTADELSFGAPTRNGDDISVPVIFRDRSGSRLGTDAGAGKRVQSLALRVELIPHMTVWTAELVPAGVCSTPAYSESSRSTDGRRVALTMLFDEETNPLPFTPDGAGEVVANLNIRVFAGTMSVGYLFHAATLVGNESATFVERSGDGLQVTGGSYGAAPLIAEAVPSGTAIDTDRVVTLRGVNLATAEHVEVDGTVVAITSKNDFEVVFTAPRRLIPSSVPIRLGINGTTIPGPTFTYSNAPGASVSGMSPTSTLINTSTQITLSGFGFDRVTAVEWNGVANAIDFRTDGMLAFTPAASPTAMSAIVILRLDDGGAVYAGTFNVYSEPLPMPMSMTPTSALTNTSPTISISGTNLQYVDTIEVNGMPVAMSTQSDSSITFVLPASAVPTSYTIALNSNGVLVPAGTVHVSAPQPPMIMSLVSPYAASAGGTEITLHGMNIAGATVLVDGITATQTFNDGFSLRFIAPPHADGSAGLVLQNEGGASMPFTLLYTSLPTITKVTPESGPVSGGQQVTISGVNFAAVPSVNFGGVEISSAGFVSQSASAIVVNSPPRVSPGPVSISVSGNFMSFGNYTYLPPPPVITSMTPASGPTGGGQLVTIQGTNFGVGPMVMVNGMMPMRYLAISEGEVRFITPAAASGSATVKVFGPGGEGLATYEYVEGPAIPSGPMPQLFSVSPDRGPASGGTTITVSGADFAPGAMIRIGSGPWTPTEFVSPTTLRAVTPSFMNGMFSVNVVNPDLQFHLAGMPVNFTYEFQPAITEIVPASGPTAGGTPFTIRGRDFAYIMHVTFDGVSAPLTNISPTEIQGVTPAHAAGVVTVYVHTMMNGVLTTSYQYVEPPPSIQLSPNPLRVAYGAAATMSATISRPQPSDTVVTLYPSDPTVVTVPPAVTIPAGSVSATFPVSGMTLGVVTITATLPPSIGGATSFVTAEVIPTSLIGVALTPSVVNASGTVKLTVAISSPVDEPVEVALHASNEFASVPLSVMIWPGALSATFNVNVFGGPPVTVTATLPAQFGGGSATAEIHPNRVAIGIPSVDFAVGETQTLTVHIDEPQPDSVTVAFEVIGTSISLSPAAVVIPAGATSATTTVTAVALGRTDITPLIPASMGGGKGYTIPVQVLQLPPAGSLAILPSPLAVEPGKTFSMTVAIGAAREVPTQVALSIDPPWASNIPPAVELYPGSRAITFPARIDFFGPVTITATADLGSGPVSVTVPVQMEALSLGIEPVVAVGATSEMYVDLGSPSDSERVVQIASSEPGVLSTPAQAVIPAGQQNAQVTIAGVAAGESTITATYVGALKTHTFKFNVSVVAPPAPGDFVMVPAAGRVALANRYFDLKFLLAEPAAAPTPVTLTSDSPAVQFVGMPWISPGMRSGVSRVRVNWDGPFTITASMDINGSARTQSVAYFAGSGIMLGLDPFESAPGRTSTLFVSLPMPAVADVNVAITQSDSSVATVPSTLTIPAGAMHTSATVTAASTGLTEITATLSDGSSSKIPFRVLNVPPAGQLGYTPSPLQAELGKEVRFRLVIPEARMMPVTVQLDIPPHLGFAATSRVTIMPGSLSAEAKFTPFQGEDFTFTARPLDAPDLAPVTIAVSVRGVMMWPAPLEVGFGKKALVNVRVVPVPTAPVTVTLSSSAPSIVSTPASVVVPAGADFATFEVNGSNYGKANLVAVLPAALGGYSTMIPASVINIPDPPLSLTPATKSVELTGGSQSETFTVSLTPRLTATTMTITSSNTSVATVPANVTIPANGTSASFSASIQSVGSTSIKVTLPPELGSSFASASLTVTQPVAQPPQIAALSRSCGTSVGGDALRISGSNLASVTSVSIHERSAVIVAATDSYVDVVTPLMTSGGGFVVVTTPAGSASAPFTAYLPPAIDSTVNPDNSVTLTVAGGAAYSWSTGATTTSITVASSGEYSVVVSYGAGCDARATTTVILPNTDPPPVTVGGISVDLPLNSGGALTVTPIDPEEAPALPPGSGYVEIAGATYEISTDATYSGDIYLGFPVPANIDPATVHVMHYENGTAVDVTYISPEVCEAPAPCQAPQPHPGGMVYAKVTSLSPFQLAVSTQLTIGAITGSVAPSSVGTSVTFATSFLDPVDTSHTITWNWGDGSSSVSGSSNVTLNDHGYNGTSTASHVYTTAGVYTVTATVSRAGASATATFRYAVIFNPEGGFVTGGGWLDSPAGAYAPLPSATGKATFGFVSKYLRGTNTPTGETHFEFQSGGFTFRSTSYEWLVVAGARAQYKGSGKVNGEGEYGFLLTAVDGQVNGGGGEDRLRLKVWDRASGAVIYDNNAGASDDATPATTLRGGSIVIHK